MCPQIWVRVRVSSGDMSWAGVAFQIQGRVGGGVFKSRVHASGAAGDGASSLMSAVPLGSGSGSAHPSSAAASAAKSSRDASSAIVSLV